MGAAAGVLILRPSILLSRTGAAWHGDKDGMPRTPHAARTRRLNLRRPPEQLPMLRLGPELPEASPSGPCAAACRAAARGATRRQAAGSRARTIWLRRSSGGSASNQQHRCATSVTAHTRWQPGSRSAAYLLVRQITSGIDLPIVPGARDALFWTGEQLGAADGDIKGIGSVIELPHRELSQLVHQFPSPRRVSKPHAVRTEVQPESPDPHDLRLTVADGAEGHE
jgi:hypothetical protein